MEWKYIGSANAGRLIEAMKCISGAIGARTVPEQVELLQSAQGELTAVITALRAHHHACRICGESAEFGGGLCIKCASQCPPRRELGED